MPEQFIAGIDIGGTKILSAIFNSRGRMLLSKTVPTRPEDGDEALLMRIIAGVESLLNEMDCGIDSLLGVAIGCPGLIDPLSGVVNNASNLGWDVMPLSEHLRDRWPGVPIFVENDAKLAALAEYTFGFCEQYPVFIYMTVSTGIGGGIVVNGEILSGRNGGAGEFGHMTVAPEGNYCGCGNRGCLEAEASGTAIAREARELVASGKGSNILRAADGRIDCINARAVGQAARDGDKEAIKLLARAFSFVGIGVANLVNMLNPHAVVIGGGLTNLGNLCFDQVRREVELRTFPRLHKGLPILPSRLGENVGIMGCLALAKKRLV